MSRLHRFCLAAAVLCAGLQHTAARAADPPTPPIKVSGLIDWYYQIGLNNPPQGAGISGRAFDLKQGTFAFNLAEANITKGVDARSPVGFTATFTLGKTADIVHLTEPGGTADANYVNNTAGKYLQQVYATMLIPGRTGATLDVGKFVTHMGYEVIESSANDHYSRGLLFTYAIPFYHAGLRLSAPLSPTLSGQLHVVNGWNNVEDDNAAKSLGLQLNWKPTSTVNVLLNYMGGMEGGKSLGSVNSGIGFPDTIERETHVIDLVGTMTPDARTKLGVNIDRGTASAKGASGSWTGYALYARRQFTTTSALAARWEHFEDPDGLRTGVGQNLSSITLTYEVASPGSLLHRLEFRHDTAGTAFFAGANAASKNQDTLTFSQVYRF